MGQLRQVKRYWLWDSTKDFPIFLLKVCCFTAVSCGISKPVLNYWYFRRATYSDIMINFFEVTREYKKQIDLRNKFKIRVLFWREIVLVIQNIKTLLFSFSHVNYPDIKRVSIHTEIRSTQLISRWYSLK